jgi:hypothetical protein
MLFGLLLPLLKLATHAQRRFASRLAIPPRAEPSDDSGPLLRDRTAGIAHAPCLHGVPEVHNHLWARSAARGFTDWILAILRLG